MNPETQAALALLPADGSAIDYAEWRRQMVAAGLPTSPIQHLRRGKQVEFMIALTSSGTLNHLVRRPQVEARTGEGA